MLARYKGMLSGEPGSASSVDPLTAEIARLLHVVKAADVRSLDTVPSPVSADSDATEA